MSKYKDDSRVIYIQHSHNMNGSAARNTGFNISTGKFICLLDDDDYFLPEKISKQLNLLLCNKTYDAAGCYWQSRGSIVLLPNKNDFTFELLTGRHTPVTGSLMIKKSAYQSLHGFNPLYTRHQDYEFLLRYFMKYRIAIYPEKLLILGTNGVSNRPNATDLEKIKIQFLNEFKNIYKNDKNFSKKVIASNYVEVLIAYLISKDFKNAIRISSILISSSTTYFLKYLSISTFRYLDANKMSFLKKVRIRNEF
jgi:glycosyltransferase involved in cell wall biosynthesis